jgi:hypothetical protein
MDRNDLATLREWFAAYCRQHYLHDPEDQRNILLKEEHTAHVCANTAAIAQGEMIDEHDGVIAEAAALFHDIGRFPQYVRYRTFLDAKSENHGLLGAKTLAEQGVLSCLPYEEQRTIIETVRFHNAFAIPHDADARLRRILSLVRDADKLDIWRVFIDFYESPDDAKASAAGLGLPETPGYSRDLLDVIRRAEVISLKALANLNDFRLLQLSWVFDLTWTTSYALLLERRHIDRIAAHFPDDADLAAAVSMVQAYAERKVTHE